MSRASPRPLDRLRAAYQYLLPHHPLSRFMHRLTRVHWTPVRLGLIRFIARRFGINIQEAAQTDIRAYEHFNAFFTRALKPGARPLAQEPGALLCPADGVISQIGQVENGRIFQAKGQDFGLGELLGGDKELTQALEDGAFATIYLSPRDYHRIHMPLGGRLTRMLHVPGRLFSVAPHNVRAVPRLFARNERVVTAWDTEAGTVAQVLVGAIFVASIETVWAGEVTPPAGKRIVRTVYDDGLRLNAGEEMGRFNMGSTVICVFPKGAVRWREELQAGSAVRMGQALGDIRQTPHSAGA